MPTELQELQLRVALIDEASLGVTKLRDELRQLSEGTGKRSLDRFRSEQAEFGKQIKELSELAEGGGKKLSDYVGKFGAAGAAFGGFAAALAVGLYSLKEFADRITDLANKAKVIGMDPATMQNIIEQYERLGVEASTTEKNLSGFSEAIAEINRIGSQRRMEMIQAAGAWGEVMDKGIARIQAQTSWEDKLNEVLTQAQNVYDNRLAETNGNIADANKAENDFLKLWNLDPSVKILRNLDRVTEERKKIIEQRAKLAADYRRTFTELGQEWTDLLDDIRTSALASDGTIVTGLRLAVDLVKALHELWRQPWVGTATKAAVGAGARAIPGVGTAITTIDLLKQGLGGGGGAPPVAAGGESESFEGRFGNWPQGGGATRLLSDEGAQPSGGKEGFSTPGFSKGWEWMRRSENIEDRRQFDQSMTQGDDYVRALNDNTAEVKRMNENFKLLDQGQVELKGLGGLPGFTTGGGGGGGFGGGAPGGGGGFGGDGGGGGRPQGLMSAPSAPYGSDAGPGTGAGAVPGGTVPKLGAQPPPSDGKGGVSRAYERRRGEPGEFNYAATGVFGKAGENLTTVKFKNGQTAVVNKNIAERYTGFINEMIDKGYPVDVRGGGGYAMRSKRGGGGLSMHSYGAALDINVAKNQMGGRTTDMPPDVEETAWKHGLSWGGRFGDPMHFEPMSPAAIASKQKQLAERGIVDTASQDKGVRSVKVETNGTLTADVNAPKGTDVKVEGGGAFNKTETNRTMPLNGNGS